MNLGSPSVGSLLPGAPQTEETEKPASGLPTGRGRILLAAGLVAMVALLGAAGYLFLGRSPAPVTGSAPAIHRTTATTAPSASASPTATSSPLPLARNPFSVATGAAASGSASGSSSASASPSGASTATATVTRTVTASAGSSAVYVGLYGYATNGKAEFRVNADAYQVSVGGTFATSYKYVSKNAQSCARVQHAGTTVTICPGEVQQLG